MREFLSTPSDDERCYPPPDPFPTFYFPRSSADLRLYDWSWIGIGICTLFAFIISVWHITSHLRYYHKPHLQRYIARILFITPIYGIDSFFAYKLYWLSVFINLIRDCYESFVIYNFFCLLLQMLGGYQPTKFVFNIKPRTALPFPLCCIKIDPSRRTLCTLRQLVLQYAFIRPICALIACILHAFGWYCPGNITPTRGYVYVSVLNFISVTLAMYALITFYAIAHKDLESFNPVPKFFAIKAIIFIMFWQSVIVAALVYFKVIHSAGQFTTDNVSNGIQSALVCCEMLLLALYHLWAFKVSEYKDPSLPPTRRWKGFLDILNITDIWADTKHSFSYRSFSEFSPLLKNASSL